MRAAHRMIVGATVCMAIGFAGCDKHRQLQLSL